jgi:hypothetical protein
VNRNLEGEALRELLRGLPEDLKPRGGEAVLFLLGMGDLTGDHPERIPQEEREARLVHLHDTEKRRLTDLADAAATDDRGYLDHSEDGRLGPDGDEAL